jgi:hypothetical protein
MSHKTRMSQDMNHMIYKSYSTVLEACSITEGVGRTGGSWCPPEGAVASLRLVSGSSGLMSSRDKACIEVGDSGWLCCQRQRLLVAVELLVTGSLLPIERKCYTQTLHNFNHSYFSDYCNHRYLSDY